MIGETCVHGQLARRCYSCELLAEIAELKADNANLRAFVAAYDNWRYPPSGAHPDQLIKAVKYARLACY